MEFVLSFEFDPDDAALKTAYLNSYYRARRITFTFRNRRTGAYHERILDEEIGFPVWPQESHLISLRKGPTPQETFEIPLLSPDGEQLPPGKYQVFATYESQGTSVHPNPAANYTGRLWRGRVVSTPTLLTVLPELPREVEIAIPTGIIARHYGWDWILDDRSTTMIRRRPGYVLTVSVWGSLFEDDKNVNEMGFIRYGVLDWRQLAGSFVWIDGESSKPPDKQLEVRVEAKIFESSATGKFGPRGDTSVLWQGRFAARSRGQLVPVQRPPLR